MLSYMRKNAGSWIIKVLFGIIVIVFVFFYGFSDVRNAKDATVATVGKRKITVGEFQKAYKDTLQFYSNIYKNRLSDEVIEQLGLKQQVLEQLIDREVLLQEAVRRQIRVTPEEVQKSILSTPSFQQNGTFSDRRYKQVLSYYGISAVDFERDQEKMLMLQTFENIVKSSVTVSERELRDLFSLKNEEATIEYIVFDPQQVDKAREVSDEETLGFYENNKESYRVPEMVRVQYLVFENSRYAEQVSVSPEEIAQYYSEDTELFFEPRKVHARHILIKAEESASADSIAAAEQKALDLLARVQNKKEDFAELATKHSEDEKTAEKGGDLGFFGRGQMVKPFEEAAFSMKPGETSSLVRSPYGFHIIRVEDVREARTKPLEEVAAEIETEIKSEKVRELVRQEARRAFNRLFKSRDLEGYAQKNGLDVNATDFFAYGQAPLDEQDREAFSKEAFALRAGELAPAFKVKDKYILLKLLERRDSFIPEPSQIRARLEVDVRKKKRADTAFELAGETLKELRQGSLAWKDVPEKKKLEIQQASFKRQGNYIKGIGKADDIKSSVFSMERDEQYAPQPFRTSRGSVIVRLVKKEMPEDVRFEEEKKSVEQTLLQQKQQEIFDQFLQGLKAEAEPKVNSKLFSSI